MATPRRSQRRRKIRWARLSAVAALALVFVLLAGGVAVWSILDKIQDPGQGALGEDLDPEYAGSPVASPGERINILLLGVDHTPPGVRSDTIMVLSLDPLTKEAALLSIPRDTRVQIDGRPGPEKIAHAYAYGGADLAVKTVEELLGVPIHYNVRVDFSGFKELVDILGGVTIDVEKQMDYEDPVQDLYIHLKPGVQVLKGDDALGYVRYRSDSDINRMDRQHKFLQAAYDRLVSIGGLLRLPQLINTATDYLRTDMDKGTMLSLAKLAAQIDRSTMVMETMPTYSWYSEDGVWYEIQEQTPEAREMVERLLWGVDREANSQLRVQVLYSPERRVEGREIIRYLADQGYNVVEDENVRAKVKDDGSTRVYFTPSTEVAGKVLTRSLNRKLHDVEPYQAADLSRLLTVSPASTGDNVVEAAGEEPENPPVPDLLVVVGSGGATSTGQE